MSAQTPSTWSHMSAAGLAAVVLKRDSLMTVGPLVGFSVSAGGMKHMCSTGKWLFGENRVNGGYGYVAKPLEATESLQAQ